MAVLPVPKDLPSQAVAVIHGDGPTHASKPPILNTDELCNGLATVAATYHAKIEARSLHPHAEKYMDAVHRLLKTMGSLSLNVNETISLQALFL